MCSCADTGMGQYMGVEDHYLIHVPRELNEVSGKIVFHKA